ncbi:MAG: zinc finger Ran-binding domain-containing protein [Sandaracinaceae bacterium]|nr:zinc finger Ran-binding domain-containing protein [Sandaracinaceae bacterium]
MATAKDQVICHVCGFKNEPESERCVSCGAKLEELSGAYSAEEEARKRDQQEGFSPKWAAVAFAVYLVLQAIALALLPLVISSYDPQGFSALMISLGLWFVGGILVGWLSPGRTFVEPAVGALFAVIPTVWWIVAITPDGFDVSMTAYVIGGLLGAMMSLFGAFLGEKLQDATRGRPKARR